MKRITLLFLFLTCIFSQSWASHILGSEMHWECLGKDSFKVTLVAYRDCNSFTFGNITLTASCQNSGSTITSSNQVLNILTTDITPVCNTFCSRCDSSGCSFKYGIERQEFIYIIDLSPASSTCCKVNLSWSTCCRPASVTTGPSGSFYYEAVLNRCLTTCDNSPVFSKLPETIICKDEDALLDLSVIDPDTSSSGKPLDSFVYSLTKPLTSQNTYVGWNGKYDYDKPLEFWGFPKDNLPLPRGFYLDENTGILQFRPMKEEVTTMAIKVSIFRAGKEIGEVRREVILYIVGCSNNDPPDILNGQITNACVGDTFKLVFRGTDPDTAHQDSVKLFFGRGNLPGNPQWEDNGESLSPTGTLKWVPSPLDSGKEYTFYVQATDNFCPLKATGTKIFKIKVYKKPVPIVNVSDSGCGKVLFSASTNFASNFSWRNNNQIISISHKFFYQIPKPGEFPFSLTVSAHGCDNTYFDTLSLKLFLHVDIGSDTALCKGSSLQLEGHAKDNNGPASYLWNDGSRDSVHTFKNLLQDGKVTLTVKDNSCSFIDDMQISVRKPLLHIGMVKKICKYDTIPITPVIIKTLKDTGDFSWVYFDGDNSGNLNWYKQGNPNVISKGNIKISDTGAYILQAQDNIGCEGFDTVHFLQLTDNELDKAINDSITYCDNGSAIEISAFKGRKDYRWNTGDTTNKIAIKGLTGDSAFTVQYQNCAFTDSIFVDYRKGGISPKVHLQNDTTICYYDSLVIDPVKLKKDTSANISYYINEGIDSLSTFNWYPKNKVTQVGLKGIIHDEGNYVLELMDESGCYHSDTIKLSKYREIMNILPKDTTICPYDWIKLETRPGYAFEWNHDPSIKDSSILVKGEGTFYLKLFKYSCEWEDSIKVSNVDLPSRVWTKEVIDLKKFEKLEAPAGYSYLWSTGSTDQSIQVTQEGLSLYWVRVSSQGCSITDSVYVYIQGVGIDEILTKRIKVYPNPTNRKLTIETPQSEFLNYRVIGIDGKIMQEGNFIQKQYQIDISDYPIGFFILEMYNENEILRKLIIHE